MKRVGTYLGIPIWELDGAPDFALLVRLNAGMESEALQLLTWKGGELRTAYIHKDALAKRKDVVLA